MKQPLAAGLLAASLLLCSGSAFAGPNDKVLVFSTPGADRYADGSPVADGECYALVWSPAGQAFAGFNADGSPAAACDRVVLAAPLARRGRCPETLFQIPAAEAAALEGGTWAVCLVDTRTASGAPAGAAGGVPRRVNRWGVVAGGVSVASASDLAAASAPESPAAPARSAAGAVAGTRSSVPESAPSPRITGLEIDGGRVLLSVEDTVPYLTYAVASGESLDAIAGDPESAVADGEPAAPIELEAEASGDCRFFRIIRAE